MTKVSIKAIHSDFSLGTATSSNRRPFAKISAYREKQLLYTCQSLYWLYISEQHAVDSEIFAICLFQLSRKRFLICSLMSCLDCSGNLSSMKSGNTSCPCKSFASLSNGIWYSCSKIMETFFYVLKSQPFPHKWFSQEPISLHLTKWFLLLFIPCTISRVIFFPQWTKRKKKSKKQDGFPASNFLYAALTFSSNRIMEVSGTG